MRAYLITTGSVFAVLALVHTWRVIDGWPRLLTDRGEMLEFAVGIAAGALSIWAWQLLRSPRGH